MRTPIIVALTVVCGTGCLESSYRYWDAPTSPAPTANAVAARARAHRLSVETSGAWMTLTSGGDGTRSGLAPASGAIEGVADGQAIQGSSAAPSPQGSDAAVHPEPRRDWVRFASLPRGGTRLEVAGPRGAADSVVESLYGHPAIAISTAHPGGELFWDRTLVADYLLSFGAFAMSGQRLSWRADGTARLGGTLARFGGGGDTPAPSVRLSLLGGLGFSGTAAEAWFRPEVVLAVDWQRIAEPIRGTLLPEGPRWVLDLSLAPLIGLDHGRHGGEVGLSLRHGAWGGVFTRVGLVDAGGPQWIWTAGVTLGTQPSVLVTVAALLIGALVGSALDSAKNGLTGVLGGG